MEDCKQQLNIKRKCQRLKAFIKMEDESKNENWKVRYDMYKRITKESHHALLKLKVLKI